MPTLAARGVELCWRELGVGPPVLLIHETGTSSAAWEAVADALASPPGSSSGVAAERSTARAVLYDRRGWGGSTAPEGYRRTTIEEQSEDAAVLIEFLDPGPAVLCGAGTGAVIALDLLLRRPELVAGAVMVEPPLMALLPQATAVMSSDLGALETESRRGRDALADLYLCGELGALGAGAARLPAELTTPGRERPASLVAELGAVASWLMPLPRLAEATRPSIIVTSESTPPLLGDASVALAARLADARERRTEPAPEPPQIGDPSGIAEIILELSGSP